MLTTLEDHLGDIEALGLLQESHQLFHHIEGHTAYKSRKNCAESYEDELISKDTVNVEGE